MKMILLPGYKDLFGAPETTYETLTSNIPSSLIISVMIMLNNELNAPIPDIENQKRLRDIVSYRFSSDQLDGLNHAYSRLHKNTLYKYCNYVFGRRYILEMIIRELNNYRTIEDYHDEPLHEYNLLIAYLMVVSDVNDKDQELFEEAQSHTNDPLMDYRLLWAPLINQYEFNEDSEPAFEIYKMLAFSKYSLNEYRAYFKRYLNHLGFDRISSYLGSVKQIAEATLSYNKDDIFKKLNYISPVSGFDPVHLREWSINSLIGKKTATIDEIRKRPLFETDKGEFMVIDGAIYGRKPYKGPLFELYYNTGLKKTISFETYCSRIAGDVMEKTVFQSIIKTMSKSKTDILCFDDTTDNIPDCYYRHGKDILLAEFKGYLFPATLSSTPNFDTIKQYLDHRFIENEQGKAKGITQIITQANLLAAGKFTFDPIFNNRIVHKKATIYPLVIHTEFHFTMPGINEYLNSEYFSRITSDVNKTFTLKPVTVVGLNVLFDYAVRGGTMQGFLFLLDRYHKILSNRVKFLKKNAEVDNYLRTKCSFDEIYRTIFFEEIRKSSPITSKQLIKMLDISQLDIDMIL